VWEIIESLGSQALATLAGASIGAAAALLASFLTAFAREWLERRGKVRLLVLSAYKVNPWDESISPPEPPRVRFGFTLSFFNEKRLDIGILDLALSWYKAGQEMVYAFVIEKPNAERSGRVGQDPPTRFLDLPARKWVHKQIEFEVEIQLREELDWQRVDDEIMEIRWVYPTGRLHSQPIPTYSFGEPKMRAWWRQSRIRTWWIRSSPRYRRRWERMLHRR
jgi:hypothetical protein